MPKNQHYSVIALMLLGLLLHSVVQQNLVQWISLDLRSGDWACSLAGQIDSASLSPLSGIEGRFLWTASLTLLLVSIGLLLAASIHSLVQRLPRGRLSIGIGLAALLSGALLWMALTTPADHRQFMQLSDGAACGFDPNPHFLFSRFLLVIFQPLYQSATLDFISYAEQLLPTLLLPCNLLLLLGLLSTLQINEPGDVAPQELSTRIGRYRLLALLASALFTTLSLYHMSMAGWFAQVMAASSSDAAEQLHALQRGITLYYGIANSLALSLFFLPTGWLLNRQAIALCEKESALETEQSRDEWMERHRLKIFSGPLMQIGAVLAPLLASGGMTLLQTAMRGG